MLFALCRLSPDLLLMLLPGYPQMKSGLCLPVGRGQTPVALGRETQETRVLAELTRQLLHASGFTCSASGLGLGEMEQGNSREESTRGTRSLTLRG